MFQCDALDQVLVEQILSLVFLFIVSRIPLPPTLPLLVLVIIAHDVLITQLREWHGRG
jgi:hypothetical protein